MSNLFTPLVPLAGTSTASAGSTYAAAHADHVHPWPQGLQAETIPADLATATGIKVSAANEIMIVPVFVPCFIVATKVAIRVSTAHNSAEYCFGLYDSIGTQLITTGAIALPSTGLVQTTVTTTNVPAGLYYFAYTTSDDPSAGTSAAFYGSAALGVSGMQRRWGKLASGGGATLPATITITSIAEDALAKPWIAIQA